jgi:hypothetical protein
MLLSINNQIDILDIITLIISLVALVATLRKKEFGKFYFTPKKDKKSDIWIKLIKSDLYDLKFVCEPYKDMLCRINLVNPDDGTDLVLEFPSETKPIFEIGLLKQNTTVKFRSCNSSVIHVEFKDTYNNHYSQKLTQEKISERFHKNFWNLTFVGS